jgi:hypothetical protein
MALCEDGRVADRDDLARRESRVREVSARRRADSERERGEARPPRVPAPTDAPGTERVQEEQRRRAQADADADRDRSNGDAG